jgi:hypothetical protein
VLGVKYTAYEPWNTCCVNRYASLHWIWRTVRLLLNTVGILCCVLTCWYLALETLSLVSVQRICPLCLVHLNNVSTSQKTYHPVDDRALCFRFPGWLVIFLVLHIIRSGCLSQSHSNPVDVVLAVRTWFWKKECVEPHLHFPTFRLWVVLNYAHEWRYVRVTHLPTSCSISSGLRRRMLQ